MRIGYGYDVHKMVENRKLILGGIEVPHDKGLLGHSDADVLTHAIMDALLSSLSLGDIGKHFPDTSDEFAGIDSKILLRRTGELIREKGYAIGNIDATVAAQAPKLNPHIPSMQEAMAAVLGIDPDCVSVKATTTEKLGFEGRKEGITAYATVLITKE